MTGKVLVVEDETKLAELLRDYLQQGGVDPSCLANGGEVVPWVRERMPDLILLDLMLGADYYICKPYSPRKVVARLKAVLRRTGEGQT